MSYNNPCPWCGTTNTTVDVIDYRLGRVELCETCVVKYCPALWSALQARKAKMDKDAAREHRKEKARALKLFAIGKQPKNPRHAYINGHSYCPAASRESDSFGQRGPVNCLACLSCFYSSEKKKAQAGKRTKDTGR